MNAFMSFDGLVALGTLTAMEIVLGIDNIVFLAILTGRLPGGRQALAMLVMLVSAARSAGSLSGTPA